MANLGIVRPGGLNHATVYGAEKQELQLKRGTVGGTTIGWGKAGVHPQGLLSCPWTPVEPHTFGTQAFI